MSAQPVIAIKHLDVTYFAGRSNEVKALSDITLDIFPGEFIVFFGPSGCGKSTLLYSIAGLERNVHGEIIVDGKNLATMKMAELEEFHQRSIGMIFQSFYLIASLNILENVALPQVGIRAGKIEREAKALALLQKFGVEAQADKLATELSGGQQQRVAICRSLINNPQILIADEPVGNLDSKSSQDVMDLLRHLNDEEKKTVILVTHDPSHLRHAHRIFYLRDGKITGTKTNSLAERVESATTSVSSLISPTAISHWLRSYGSESEKGTDQAETLGRKAQEILAEVMTGLTATELMEMQMRIVEILEHGRKSSKDFVEFLRKPVVQGGIGMAPTKAMSIARTVREFVQEVEVIQNFKTVKNAQLTASERAVQQLRRFILHVMHGHLSGNAAVVAMDRIIGERMKAGGDRMKVQKLFSMPVLQGGAGMHVRNARKASKILEAVLASGTPPTVPDDLEDTIVRNSVKAL